MSGLKDVRLQRMFKKHFLLMFVPMSSVINKMFFIYFFIDLWKRITVSTALSEEYIDVDVCSQFWSS